jgi:hypothetical protein
MRIGHPEPAQRKKDFLSIRCGTLGANVSFNK